MKNTDIDISIENKALVVLCCLPLMKLLLILFYIKKYNIYLNGINSSLKLKELKKNFLYNRRKMDGGVLVRRRMT